MKLASRALLVSVVAMAPAVSAGDATAAHAAASRFLGSWSLDTSRMSIPPDQRPKSVMFTFGDAGADKLAMHVDIIYAPGSEVHSASTVSLDGPAAIVENSPEADHVTVRAPTSGVLVMALQKDGVLVSTRIYAVAPDDRNLVETTAYPGNNDTLVMRTSYFRRVR